MVQIKNKFGSVVSRGKNLATINRFASKNPVVSVDLYRSECGIGTYNIWFDGGFFSIGHFQSFQVMVDWFLRKTGTNWVGVDLRIHNSGGYLIETKTIGRKVSQ